MYICSYINTCAVYVCIGKYGVCRLGENDVEIDDENLLIVEVTR